MKDQFKRLGIEDALRVGPFLDVGGANGDVVNMLRFEYPDAILINADFSHGMLMGAQDLANYKKFFQVRLSADGLPFRDKSIRILHTFLLSGSDDGTAENFCWEKFVREADRVMMPGGFYIIGEDKSAYGNPFIGMGYKIISGHEEPSNCAILQKCSLR